MSLIFLARRAFLNGARDGSERGMLQTCVCVCARVRVQCTCGCVRTCGCVCARARAEVTFHGRYQ